MATACKTATTPPVPLPDRGVRLRISTANAWHGLVGRDYVVKAVHSENEADALENDAVTCALIMRLRRARPELLSQRLEANFLTYHGSFVGFVRRSGSGVVLGTAPGDAPCKCMVTALVPGHSLGRLVERAPTRAGIRNVVAALSHMLASMLVVGEATGFVHNDAHMSNVLYNPARRAFVLIDYGKASFDSLRLARVLGARAIAATIHKECCQLGATDPPTRLHAFYLRYAGYEQKFPATALGRRDTRRIAVMHDIATLSFMPWYMLAIGSNPAVTPARRRRRIGAAGDGDGGDGDGDDPLGTCGIVAFSADSAALVIPSTAKEIVARAVRLREATKTHVFAPVAAGLAWMAIYILSYFEAIDGGADATRPTVEFAHLDVFGSNVTTHPLYYAGQMTRHGLRVADAAMNRNLVRSRFKAALLTSRRK